MRGMPMAPSSRGFTLIELLVVVALIAIASSVASLALRDPQATQLEREAVRLVSLLESARAAARSTGLAVQWVPGAAAQAPGNAVVAADFRFVGLPTAINFPTRWLDGNTTANVVGARSVSLGPEPVIGPQRIVLSLGSQQLMLATDGLAPFTVADLDRNTGRPR
ncbi:MAG: prepilin-type N-terminal cleavage/methylation domain-containing protein [Rhizobacter sp.]